ncbi:hypothetical protein LT493_01780 [Streptomyces tricolor]|nr:hypothetical protein [Streptomyces tricolor]
MIAGAALLPPLLILPMSGTDDTADRRLQDAFTNASREFHAAAQRAHERLVHAVALGLAPGRAQRHGRLRSDAPGGRRPRPAATPAPDPHARLDGHDRPRTGAAGSPTAVGDSAGHAVQPADLQHAARLIQVPAGRACARTPSPTYAVVRRSWRRHAATARQAPERRPGGLVGGGGTLPGHS